VPLTAEVLRERIRLAIESADGTQESAAKAMGIDPTALSKALAGKRNFSTLEIARFCEAYRIDPLALLGNGEPPQRPAPAEDAERVKRAAELDRLLTAVGYPPSRDRRYPATLLDRAIEAWLAGHISIRPIAGLIGVNADELLEEVQPVRPWPPTTGAPET